MRAGAVSVETAQPLDGLRWLQARRLQRLIGWGVVRQTVGGQFYLDVPILAEHLTNRRRRAAIAIALVLMLMALTTYFSWGVHRG
jgi:hypothetical protein